MNDLVNRQDAIDALMAEPLKWDDSSVWESARCHQWTMDMGVIKALPSAQPEIVHCKDCLHWVRTCGDDQWGVGDCDVFEKHLVMCEGYCAWAERREE